MYVETHSKEASDMPHELMIKRPKECSGPERSAFIALAGKSNEVDPNDLESGFDRARFVLWTQDEKGVAGVAALKIPRQSYWEGVFEKSESGLSHAEFPLEFGYLYVEEDRRKKGLGHMLIQRTLILAGSEGIFATTREKNTRVHSRLIEQGFQQAGSPYKSKRGDFNLLLFVRTGGKVSA
jgi:GNAT superfamily N-acetyltransferase